MSAGVPGLGTKPTDQARQVSNATQAQRYRRQWTEEVEDPDGDGDVAELTAAIDILERKFGDKLPANPLAAGLRSQTGDKRRSGKPMKPSQRRTAGETAPKPPKSPAKRRRSSSGASRFLPSGGQALEATGIPGASRSTAASVMQFLGLTVAASLLYLFLDNAEKAGAGKSAIEQTWEALSGGIRRILDPVDPLAPAAASSRRRRAPAAHLSPSQAAAALRTAPRLRSPEQLLGGHRGRRRPANRHLRGPGARTR